MTTYKVWNGTSWEYIDNQNYDARYLLRSELGSNNGAASLDSSGHIPSEQLPLSIVGAVSYKGTFDPTSGAPTPAAQGYYYVSDGVGTIDTTSFATGDWLVYRDDTNWDKIGNSSASVTWSNVSGKPASYTPDTHDNTSHSVEYITVDGVTYEALLANDDIGTGATQVSAGNHTHSEYQPIDGDLTAIAGLSGSAGLLRKTASNTWTLDTNTYLTELSTVGNATNWDTASRPSFTGNALKYLRLNEAGNAFEFATVEAGASSFLSLTDTPSSYSGYDETYYVRVNATSNALEFATVPSSYTLPVASADVLGGVKIGSGITITDGVISASGGAGGSSTLVQRSLEGVVYETTLMYWRAPAACTINSVSMSLSSNPSAPGSYCKVQVMKNGLLETDSIFTSDTPMQVTETTTATNGLYSATGTLDSGQTTLVEGDVIHFRVNQADTGSADLLVQMKVTFT
jgi:hypothetical protein